MSSRYDHIITCDFLQDEYVEKENSMSNIAGKVGCCRYTVWAALKHHGFPSRTMSEGKTIQLAHDRENREQLNIESIIDYLDGLLLGDGNLSLSSDKTRHYRSCIYRQPCIHKEWLTEVQNTLSTVGIISTIKYRPFYDKRSSKNYWEYDMWTHSYPELKEQRERWYPEGTKEVPEDVGISSESVAQWYMGDGYRNTTGGSSFATNGFTLNEVEFLCGELNCILGIDSHPMKTSNGNFVVYVPKRNTQSLFDYIEPYILPCFEYKIGG